MPLTVTSGSTVNVYCSGSDTIDNYSTRVIDGTASVSPSTETTVILYSIPSDITLYISDIFCTGDADGEFKIYKDSSVITEGRTSSSQRTFTHSWSRPYRFQAGEILKVTVTHYESSVVDFVSYVFGTASTT